MEWLLWLLLLAYIFWIGHHLVKKMEGFIRNNPKAFPGSRKIQSVPRPKTGKGQDDGTCKMWYNDSINAKEPQCHENCDP